MEPPPVPAAVLQIAFRAGFWLRAVAWGIDAFIGSAVGLLAAGAAILGLDLAGATEALGEYAGGIAFAAAYLAYTTFEVFKAATPGKMILGLVIATAAGAPADRWTLALRWSTKNAPMLYGLIHLATLNVLGQILAGVLNYAFLFGCLQALDEHKRAWHDEWSGTAVYRRPRPRPGARPGPSSFPQYR